MFLACDKKPQKRGMLNQDFDSNIVRIIQSMEDDFLEECKFRDEENILNHLEEIESSIKDFQKNNELNELQKRVLVNYEKEVLPKLSGAAEILSKSTVNTAEFTKAKTTLERAKMLSFEIFSQSSGR